ncbi:hypothetical protein ACLQ25_18490 [Micromonospora sp. DT44]
MTVPGPVPALRYGVGAGPAERFHPAARRPSSGRLQAHEEYA